MRGPATGGVARVGKDLGVDRSSGTCSLRVPSLALRGMPPTDAHLCRFRADRSSIRQNIGALGDWDTNSGLPELTLTPK